MPVLRRTPIFAALDPNIVASGLTPDIHGAMRPLWSAGENVEFVDGKVRNRRGDRRLLQVETGPIKGLEQQRLSNGEIALWLVQNLKLWRWDRFSLGQQFTYEAGSLEQPYFDFTAYGDWLLINRGTGAVQFWNGATFGILPEMPTNVVQIHKHLSFLIALGVGSKNTGAAWCDANDISKWIPSRTNTAGALYFDEFDGGIVCGEPLGPVLAVYSETQMGILSFIGSPFYFGQKVLMSGIGAVGPQAVTALKGMNYGMSRQGAWVTDGQQFEYIDKGRMHNYFQDNVNWQVGQKIIVVRNDVLRTVEYHLPVGSSTEINEAWSFDPANKGWSKIPPSSFFNQDMPLGLPVRATPEGQLLLVGDRNYTSSELLLQTRPMLMQLQGAGGLTDTHFDTKVDEVELLLHDVQNVVMYIGSSKEHNGTIHWSTPIPLAANKSTYPVPANVPDGTYWHLKFVSVETTAEVVEDVEPVFSNGELVVGLTSETAWRLNLQGFTLFGAVEGSK